MVTYDLSQWKDLLKHLFFGQINTPTTWNFSLDLSGLRVRSLPDDFVVAGDLDLRQCQRLRTIGRNLRVGHILMIGGGAGRSRDAFEYIYGHFLAKNEWYEIKEELQDSVFRIPSRDPQSPLKELPEGLHVGESLFLRNCRYLKKMPRKFHLGGSLFVQSCPAFQKLPDGMTINGSLTLTGCPSFKSLPAGLKVTGSLNLTGLPITHLPKDMEIDGSLLIENCPNLMELPEHLCVQKKFVLRGGPISQLPRTLSVKRNLVVEKCHEIKKIPESLLIGGSLCFKKCEGLTDFPANLVVRESLRLIQCPNLKKLPDGLTVPNTLDLACNPALKKLPAKMNLGSENEFWRASLIITDCEGITSLPDDMKIHHGGIDLAGSGVRDMPESRSKDYRIMWRGTSVASDLVFHPERLSVRDILTERNAELRRLMLERLGADAVLKKAQAVLIDQDTDPGGTRSLIEITVDSSVHRYLRCLCPSTGREYLLRVAPSVSSCHAAAAWLAGFDDPSDYQPIQET